MVSEILGLMVHSKRYTQSDDMRPLDLNMAQRTKNLVNSSA